MSESERLLLAILAIALYSLLCLLSWFNHLRKSRQQNGQVISDEGVILVAYASQTGTAEALARQSAAQLEGTKPYQILPLNQVNEAVLANTRQALFVVSTYGEGEPPDNGAAFARHFLTDTISQDLSHLQFSVMALGDKLYQQFCGFGHQLYQGLSQLGATPVTAPLESCANEGHRAQELISKWQILSGLHTDKVADKVNAPLIPEFCFEPWQLTERVWLNSGSPGAPAYLIGLTSMANSLNWQAGDIAELKFTGGAIRHYSIASLPESGVIELIVRQHQFADGSLGLGSGWLTHAAALNDKVELRIKANPAFHSTNTDTPAIFIGSGTGLAGLRGHILQRVQSQASQNWLIFGERDPQKDDFLQAETANWVSQGVKVSKAFSRDADNPQYVQDIMLQQADKLKNWLQQGAVIYVCGNRKGMAHGVDNALQQILSEQQYEQLIIQQRYRRDIY
ncbi:sulfite reductase subunit alpha [Neptunicella sp. SCSIO 80796]|uniref:sulfite reductase subunit alpha n=1 Tax=Neptunicella plasticusilytica TaxID=3117012 RepID=UPI003A4D9741